MYCKKCGKEANWFYYINSTFMGCTHCYYAQPQASYTVVPAPQYGWTCPKCGRIHAPFITGCHYCNNANFDNTKTSTEEVK